jgi:hypothetical protein
MRWHQAVVAFAGATVALVVLVGAALAGGWAVTTIDALPEGGFQAGQTYRLGYWIRQHGQNPFAGARTSIRVTSASTGESQVFSGQSEGPAGHYVAEVTFPSAGEWTWEVSQDPFAVQSLGTVSVAPPTVGGPDPGLTAITPESTLAATRIGEVPVALPLALLFVLAVVTWPLMGIVRRQRSERTPTSPQVARAAE